MKCSYFSVIKRILLLTVVFLAACADFGASTPTALMPVAMATVELAPVSATAAPIKLPPTATSTATPMPTAMPIRQSDGHSYSPEISDNGRYIAFISRGKLTENSIHDAESLFVFDRETGQIELVSVALDGNSSEGWAFNIALSSSGRYVGFHSHGGDMVKGDDELCDGGMSNCADLFVYDRRSKKMIRIPLGIPTGEGGGYYPWVIFSPDERFFCSVNDQCYDLKTSEPVSPKPITDYLLSDGSALHFWNSHENDTEEVNPGMPLNGNEVVNWGDISGGGTIVAFSSMATDLTDNPINQCEDARWSEEGIRPCINIFVRSLETGETWLATVGKDGWSSNADTSWPKMSANGRFLTFHTAATNLTEDDFSRCNYYCSNVYLQDLQTGEITLISREIDSHLPAGYSRNGDISGDGRFVTFSSGSDNLVLDDTNEVDDVFVYDRLTEEITRVSLPNAPAR